MESKEKNIKEKNINIEIKFEGILLSILLILIGILFLSFNFGWLDITLRPIIFSWPMIFIVLAVFSIFKKKIFQTILWFALGSFFLLPRLAAVYPDTFSAVGADFTAKYWPIWLIIIGVGLLFHAIFNKKNTPLCQKTKRLKNQTLEDGFIDIDVVFSGSENIVLDPIFKGGEIDIVFGGITLDLRRTTLPEGITILYADVVFGGLTLILPETWNVVTQVDTVLGGVTDKRSLGLVDSDKSRQLHIKGDFVFGGLELR